MIFNEDEFNGDEFEMFNFGKNARSYHYVRSGNHF